MFDKLDTGVSIRLSKAFLVLSFAIFSTLVVLGNITDYYTNFEFVTNVLGMEHTFNDAIMYRSITNITLHHIGYVIIILVEAFIMVCCWVGGLKMVKNVNKDSIHFHESKKWGIIGMTAGLAVWFLGFQAIAGEWFGMWMNQDWNGIPDAERLTMYLLGTLIFVSLKNDDVAKL